MYYVNNQRIKLLDPATVGLRRGTKVGKDRHNNFYLMLDRKSRIIMKDGFRIQKQKEMILEKNQNAAVSLAAGAPVCGKPRAFLEKQGIAVFVLERR